jgi:hypothetical protein
MTLRQPMAVRPLALLTLAVAGAHGLLLSSPLLLEAPRSATVTTLVTRVLFTEEPARDSVRKPVDQGGRDAPRELPAPRTAPRSAVASSTQEAPPSLIDSPPAPAPATPQAQAMAVAIPAPVRLLYAVTGQSRGRAYAADGQLAWRHDGSEYEARLAYSTASAATRALQSSGRITAEGLAPQRFSERGRGEQAAHFQRDSGTLLFSNNAPPQPLLPGAQDRLSVLLQLAAMLAAAPAKFPAGSAIAVQTVGTRDAQPWLFTVEGDEALDLPGGRVATLKLVRLPRGDYDIRVELWLGTAMDYVPVRIRLTQANGDFVDQQWTSTDRS